jgi:hypothetical protein
MRTEAVFEFYHKHSSLFTLFFTEGAFIVKLICEFAPHEDATQPLKSLSLGMWSSYNKINAKYLAEKKKFDAHFAAATTQR